MRIKQHLVALQQIGSQDEGAAVTEHKMGDLEFDAIPLIAMALRFTRQPADQRMLLIIQFGGALQHRIARFHHATGQVLTDCVTGQPGSS